MSEQPVIKTKARTILHVGAGAGKRLAEWQSGGPDKIVLVEAERAAAARLSQKAATAPNVQVVQAALGTEAGDAELSLWNFSRLNSLQEPTPDLHELFPGLIRKDRQIVPVITPADLFAMIGDVARPLSVIVETPGNEMVFLTACKADGVLDQIDQLEILAPEDAFYNGAATRAELETWLVHEGFAVTARDNADADWTVLHLAADHNARALSEAKARIDALTKTIVAGEATLSETQSALKAAKERAEMLETALAEARAATDAKTKALAERDAALKAAQDRAAGLETVLAEARLATEAKAKTLAERDAAIKAATDKISELEATVADLGKQRHSAEQKRDEAMSTLDFQTRFQAMLQVDLEALRGRLEQSETQRQRQEELLGKLTSKLSLAAEYLRHLPPSAQESLTSASKPELESPRRRSSGKKQKTKAAQGRGA